MENTLAVLGPLAISGLAFVAYKHPQAYFKFFFPISLAAMFAAWCFAMGWDSGIDRAVLLSDPSKEARNALRAEQFGLLWILVGLPACMYGLIALTFLPSIFGIRSEEEPKTKPPKKRSSSA